MTDNFGEHAPHMADDEWTERMLAEGERRARCLGIVLVSLLVVALVAIAWGVLR